LGELKFRPETWVGEGETEKKWRGLKNSVGEPRVFTDERGRG